MEIRDWIRAIGSRLALIAVVAGVAALLAATLALFQAQQYRATATVALPDVPTFGPLTSAVGQRVANFEGAVTSDGVLDAVAEETGAPRESLDTLNSARSGSSNVVEVRFVGTEGDLAREVVVAASQQALLLQAETDAAFALAEADVSEAAFNEAQASYDAKAAEIEQFGSPDLLLTQLERDYVRVAGDATEEEIAELNERLLDARELKRLRDAADAALGIWQEDLALLAQAEGRIVAAETAQVRVGDVVPLSKLRAIASQAIYAALFGAALAIGFVVIVELLRSGGGPSRPSLPRPSRQRTPAGAF